MIRKITLAASVALLAGCGGGGDININPTTNDSSVNNSNNTTTNEGGGSGASNPCAFYVTDAGQTVQGSFDDASGDCTYSAAFVSAGNPLTVDLNIPPLPNDGVHIFQGDMIVGVSYDTIAEANAAGIEEGGDGPRLTIEPGVTMAWPQGRSLIVNRGSQIIAAGTRTAPITLTSTIDAAGGNDAPGDAGAEAVEQWGGVIIDGFGVVNACAYTGNRFDGTLALVSDCSPPAEGIAGAAENRYGGLNDEDNSGRLEFVLVKHTGGDLGSGNDLNGITFNGVGSATVVNNIETYSTLDDGIEMFGGAVNITNYAGIYNRDDSIDIDSGWIGTLDTALVIHSATQGNHCIEADGVDDHDERVTGGEDLSVLVGQGLVSAPTIRNLTCIVSPSAQRSQDPGAGWRLREFILPKIEDSQVIMSYLAEEASGDNYCLRIEDGTQDTLDDGTDDRDGNGELQYGAVVLDNILMACEDTVESVAQADAEAEGVLFATIAGAVDPTATADTNLVVLEGTPSIFSVETSSAVVDDTTPPALDNQPAAPDFIGTFRTTDTNVFADWTYGIFDGNRAQPLFFEPSP